MTTPTTSAEAARQYLERGLMPLPIPPRSKNPGRDGWQHERVTAAEVDERFAGGCNIGILLGEPSGGLIDVDLDCPEARELADEFLPQTPVITGREGNPASHRWYIVDNPPKTRQFHDPKTKAMMVEFRSTGGQTIVGPSIHPDDGDRYDLLTGDPARVSATLLMNAVEALAKAVIARRYPPVADSLVSPRDNGRVPPRSTTDDAAIVERAWRYISKMRDAISGSGGHVATFAAACVCFRFGLSMNAALEVLGRFNAEKTGGEPWTDAELAHKLHDALAEVQGAGEFGVMLSDDRKATATTPAKGERRRFACSDMGNAERFASHFAADAKYVSTWGAWHLWRNTHWRRDDTDESVRLAKRAVRLILDEARHEQDDNRRAALAKWAGSSESATKIDAMLRLAQSEPGIALPPEAFDADPWLFNCLNGTIDLRTGKLRPHSRDDLITKISPVEFDPEARSETWERFLHDSTGGDCELASFLQRSIGYAMTGLTSEERFWFIHGPGASGKSTFIESVKATFGDYAVTADFESFLARHNSGGGARGDLARLAGARFVTSIEVDDGRRLAEGLVKQLTGGDAIACRRLYEGEFEYRPQFSLWLVANHRPKVRHDDDAIWRRVLLTPFDRAVPEAQRDPDLKACLIDVDRSGAAILTWAVQGCLAWQRDGLRVPAAVRAATDRYRGDMDPLGDFYADCCTFGPNESTYQSVLLTAYRKWAETAGVQHPLNRKTIGPALEAHGGFEVGVCAVTRRITWRGISLREGDKP